ncbi:hypothetical protein [Nonomuraea sp. KM90]|uniref:hypothetical protein n=1 Tax=Nonomuraea sp. KM90 TaxID=3457428 RepID=UPI003FCD70F0
MAAPRRRAEPPRRSRISGSRSPFSLTTAQFMGRFRALREQGQRIGESIDDVTFPPPPTSATTPRS